MKKLNLKRQVLTALLALLLVFLLTACGGEQSDPTSPSVSLPVANVDGSLPALEDSEEDLGGAQINPADDSNEDIRYSIPPQDDTLEDLG